MLNYMSSIEDIVKWQPVQKMSWDVEYVYRFVYAACGDSVDSPVGQAEMLLRLASTAEEHRIAIVEHCEEKLA